MFSDRNLTLIGSSFNSFEIIILLNSILIFHGGSITDVVTKTMVDKGQIAAVGKELLNAPKFLHSNNIIIRGSKRES